MAPAVTGGAQLDVLVVGAGLSGIGAGHYLQTHCPWARYEIFESRSSVGGTWDLFRYPGIRSDSDMHTLGYSFRPWVGERSIADGPSILRYIEDTAAESGIDEHIHLEHRVIGADWVSDESRWHVTIERMSDGVSVETVQVTAGFVFACSGYYRYDHGYLPDFAGVDDFAGRLVHPQHWPEDLAYANEGDRRRRQRRDCGDPRTSAGPIGRTRHDVATLPDLYRRAARAQPGRGDPAQDPAGQGGGDRQRSGSTRC